MPDPKDLVIKGGVDTHPHLPDALGPVVRGESTGINVGVLGSSKEGSGVVGETDSETPTFLEYGTAGVQVLPKIAYPASQEQAILGPA